MLKLTQFPLCPLSRSIRLALADLDLPFEMAEEHAWKWRPAFLALNPAGDLPVLEAGGRSVICGAYAISEYLAEASWVETCADPEKAARGIVLFPGDPEQRAEVRRLVDWFHLKFDREVSRDLLIEKVYPRVLSSRADDESGDSMSLPPPPDPQVQRAIRANLKYHLSYIGFLSDQRRWLAGDAPSFADLAAAAHVSVADFLGEIAWEQHPSAKAWYQRIKSRPSFRPLLADRLPGFQPPSHYADLDF
ncbi:MAG: glutathione S-transferase family protein [Hyphomicrobiaceae bacterium]